MQGFAYDPVAGRVALDAAAGATSRIAMKASDVSNALMAAMVTAETLAAAHGYAVPIPTEDGQTGYVIGGARDRIVGGNIHERPATIYLALQQAVRRANASATKATPASSILQLPPPAPSSEGVGPLAIVLIVAGVAALVAGAWYVGKYTGQVEVEGKEMAKVAAVEKIAQLAVSGQPIDPKAYDALVSLSQAERGAMGSALPWIAGGLAIAGVAAYAIPKWMRRRRR